MLHPDSNKRIEDINRLAELFEQKGYKTTSTEIKYFTKILEQKKVPADFLKKLDNLLDIFEKEFANALQPLAIYRKKCSAEIRQLVIEAIGRMKADFATSYMQVYPVTVNLKHGRFIIGDIADELAQNPNLTDKGKFYFYCYSYLVLVEGVFDEVARILYFLKTVTPTNIPTTQQLKNKTVWAVYNEIQPTPAFLENWEEKKHIRNAIGHASFSYDPTKKEARFIDEMAGYDATKSLSQFMEMAVELESCVEAYTYFTLLLRLYDLIISPNPF